jgi:hypothetical protein
MGIVSPSGAGLGGSCSLVGVMSAQVIELVTEQRVDEAWCEYSACAIRLRDDPGLLFDRTFNEEMARKHEKWKRLFLRMEWVA